jgi:virginiamycin B lyase
MHSVGTGKLVKITTPFLAVIFSLVLAASMYSQVTGATLSGTVTDATGTPVRSAFVRAKNAKNQITTIVLTDSRGQYRFESLSPGAYKIEATAVGYKTDVRSNVGVGAVPLVSQDFSLQKGIVRWSDLSVHQGQVLLPDDPGKELLFDKCMNCHGFQSREASSRRDEDGWRQALDLMRDPASGLGYFNDVTRVSDQDAATIVSYLNTVFGVDSDLPRDPSQLAGYDKVKQTFPDEAMKIVYVLYDLPGPNRMPWNANPDPSGKVWVPYYGFGNQIAKLDPETGVVQEFRVPNKTTAGIHSAVMGSDGYVWFAEQGAIKIGKFDPNASAMTEYSVQRSGEYMKGTPMETWPMVNLGHVHTIREDRLGFVWTTGNPLRRFDTKTGKWNEFREIRACYGIDFDKDGNVWFANYPDPNAKIGMVDIKTLKVTTYAVPTTNGGPRRIAVDRKGFVWFTEYDGNKIGRFDPKTKTFKEISLPDQDPSPYAIGIDRNDFVWFNSDRDDIIGRLDPKNDEIIEYPFPYAEIGIREIRPDEAGRMWFTSPANNKIGYFIPPDGKK